jgi:hypothetical protein
MTTPNPNPRVGAPVTQSPQPCSSRNCNASPAFGSPRYFAPQYMRPRLPRPPRNLAPRTTTRGKSHQKDSRRVRDENAELRRRKKRNNNAAPPLAPTGRRQGRHQMSHPFGIRMPTTTSSAQNPGPRPPARSNGK